MATPTTAPSPETPITIKITLNSGENRRIKLPLRELGANTLPGKVGFMSHQPCRGQVLNKSSTRSWTKKPRAFPQASIFRIPTYIPCSCGPSFKFHRIRLSLSSGTRTALQPTSISTAITQRFISSSIAQLKLSSSFVFVQISARYRQSQSQASHRRCSRCLNTISHPTAMFHP